MAAAGDIVDEEQLDHEEINIAVSLSEALQADEVERFLVLYDSIPSIIATERVDRIKEMARQLAALPKKQFELYRSKKVLAGNNSPLVRGHGLNLTGRLLIEKSHTADSAFVGLGYTAVKRETIQISAESTVNQKDDALVDTTAEVSTSTRKKKKKKAKKSKSQDSTQSGRTVSSEKNESIDLNASRMEEKLLDVAGGKQISVRMNKDIVVDISTNFDETIITGSAKDSGHLGASGTTKGEEQNGNLCAAELCSDNDTTDLARDPPFGFPPCPEKIFMSALGLLPSSSISINEPSTTHTKPSEKTAECTNATDHKVSLHAGSSSEKVEQCVGEEKLITPLVDHNVQSTETVAPNSCLEAQTREELHDSLTSPPGDFMVEADSIDGDVSSSSAKEDEGWQSQTKRPYRKKKRELAARASREKMQMERNQRRWDHRQQYEHTKRNHHHLKKTVEDRNTHSCKDTELNPRQYAKGSEQGGQPKAGPQDAGCLKRVKEAYPPKSTTPKEDPISEKTFSYRDALMSSKKPKELENPYSSDSGVDANSVSSCESVVQPESPKQAPFNHDEVVSYLKKGWQEILQASKKGLVSVYGMDAPSVTRKWQTTQTQPKSAASPTRVVR